MKTAIITGASSGLGREFVRQLSEVFPEIESYWLIARRKERLEEMAQALPDKTIECLGLDLCDPMSFVVLQEKLTAQHPEVALLVNNAGCGYLGNLGEVETSAQTRDGGFESAGADGGHQYDRPTDAAGWPYSQRILHRVFLSKSTDDRLLLYEGVCLLVYGWAGGGAAAPGDLRDGRVPRTDENRVFGGGPHHRQLQNVCVPALLRPGASGGRCLAGRPGRSDHLHAPAFLQALSVHRQGDAGKAHGKADQNLKWSRNRNTLPWGSVL